VATLAADGRKCGLALRRLVTGDLRGMFDAPTTSGVTLGGPLTVIDLSRMYNSPALGIIMLCANAWQQAAVSRSDGGKWIAVSEEAWATLRYNSVARAMQESFKLARSYGVQHVIVMHRLSDLEAAGAAGSETRTLAQGLLEDTETRIILNQPPGEIATAVRLLGPHRGRGRPAAHPPQGARAVEDRRPLVPGRPPSFTRGVGHHRHRRAHGGGGTPGPARRGLEVCTARPGRLPRAESSPLMAHASTNGSAKAATPTATITPAAMAAG
jgi:hypothetical protein